MATVIKFDHGFDQLYIPRDHFVNVPSQWETTLHRNVVSHWLWAYTKWSPHSCQILHYSDVMATQTPATWMFVQLTTRKTSKLNIIGPLWEAATGNSGIPLAKGNKYRKHFPVKMASWKEWEQNYSLRKELGSSACLPRNRMRGIILKTIFDVFWDINIVIKQFIVLPAIFKLYATTRHF